jgi:hypothetical protein
MIVSGGAPIERSKEYMFCPPGKLISLLRKPFHDLEILYIHGIRRY